GRTLEVLALVAEGLFIEAFEKELKSFLEVFAVGLGIEERRAERLDLARMISAAHAHDDAPVGDDVGHGIVFREPDRVPHRQHIEGAAEFEPLRLRRKPEAELDEIRQALIAFALEMMLGGPKRVKAELVHGLRHVATG